jgi:DNA-binding NarL/FixJ family response regulator
MILPLRRCPQNARPGGPRKHREIADALYLSPLTVKTDVSRILTRLRVRDRVQLVVIAYQAGLVSPQ